MPSEERFLQLRPGAAKWLEIEGETVVLDVNRSHYLGLNPTASLLWDLLSLGTTRDGLVTRLQTSFNLGHDQAEGDVDAFLDVCEQRGLLA